jgi:hypothetical protein
VLTLVRWLGYAVLVGLLAAQIVRRGPLELRAPRTVLSNSHPAQKAHEPYLLFLREVRSIIPRNAAITVIPTDPTDITQYLIALGQLPEQRVLLPPVLGGPQPGTVPGPHFFAAQAADLPSGPYRLIRRLPGGNLYQVSQ